MKKVIVFLLMSFYLNTIAQCVQPDIPTISASSTSICNNQSATLSIASGSLNNATNWHWYSGSCGGTPVGTGTQVIVTLGPTTTYYVRGEGGCATPGTCANITINVWPVVFAISIFTTQASCGNANGIASVNVTGGSPPYSFSWNTFPPQLGPSASNLSAGSYSLMVTDNNSCTVGFSANISAAPLPTATVVSQNAMCFGQNNGSATVIATGVCCFTYTWITTGLNSAIANGLGVGTHSVVIKDGYGCPIYTTITITQPNPISLTVAPPQTICYGTMGQVYASANGGTTPYFYTLTNLTNNITNTLITSAGINSIQTLTSTTQFTASVIDANGCANGPQTIIANVRPPLIAANATVVACDRDSIVISPSIVSVGNGGPYTYNWINNPTTSYSISVIASLTNTPQNFTVAISDACTIPSTSAVITVSVSACVGIEENKNSDPAISFYPNPVNDILLIASDQVETLTLKILSVLGKEVLQQDLAQDKNVIDLSGFDNGIYFLSFYNKNEKLKTQKIIVQH